MTSKDKKVISQYNYALFRCIEIGKYYAYGVIEGRPGIYARCKVTPDYTPEKSGKILNCPKEWEFEPYAEMKEGHIYVVEREALNNLNYEHFVKCNAIYKIKNNTFDFIPYEERFGDDTVEEIAEIFNLDEKERGQLKIYQKAYGYSYRATEYEFTVVTKRGGWRYNILKHALYHEGHLAKNKVSSTKGVYLQGWHRQRSDYLENMFDALSYVTNHDYGITSEIQGSATMKNVQGNEKFFRITN